MCIKEKNNKLKIVQQMLAKHEDITMIPIAKNIEEENSVFMEGLWITSKTKESRMPQKQIPIISKEKSSAKRIHFFSKNSSASAVSVPKTKLKTNTTKMVIQIVLI